MRGERVPGPATYVMRVAGVTAAAAAGFLAGSVWVGLAAVAGVLVLNTLGPLPPGGSLAQHVVKAVIGLALLAVAAFLGALAGRWIWTTIWLIAGVSVALASGGIRRHSVGFEHAFNGVFVATVGLAVISPYLGDDRWRTSGFYVWCLAWTFGTLIPSAIFHVNRDDRRTGKARATWVVFVTVVAALMGAAAEDVLVGLLVWIGVALLAGPFFRTIEGDRLQYRRHARLLLAAVAAITVASWRDGLAAGGAWVFVWGLVAAALLSVGAQLFGVDRFQPHRKRIQVAGSMTLAVGGLALAFALFGPGLLASLPATRGLLVFVLLVTAASMLFVGLLSRGAGWLWVPVGLTAVGAAWTLSQSEGRWLWTGIWAAVALALFFGDSEHRRLRRATDVSAGVMALLIALTEPTSRQLAQSVFDLAEAPELAIGSALTSLVIGIAVAAAAGAAGVWLYVKITVARAVRRSRTTSIAPDLGKLMDLMAQAEHERR